jgi:hypothetical protein
VTPSDAASTPGAAGVAPEDEAPLEWSVNPWRESAPRAALALAALAASWAAVLASGLVALTSAVLMIAAAFVLSPGFAGSRCRLDARGAARRLAFLWWDLRPWSRIRTATMGSRALLVTPERSRGTLAVLRGLVLPLPAAPSQEGLRQEIKQRIARHGL